MHSFYSMSAPLELGLLDISPANPNRLQDLLRLAGFAWLSFKSVAQANSLNIQDANGTTLSYSSIPVGDDSTIVLAGVAGGGRFSDSLRRMFLADPVTGAFDINGAYVYTLDESNLKSGQGLTPKPPKGFWWAGAIYNGETGQLYSSFMAHDRTIHRPDGSLYGEVNFVSLVYDFNELLAKACKQIGNSGRTVSALLVSDGRVIATSAKLPPLQFELSSSLSVSEFVLPNATALAHPMLRGAVLPLLDSRGTLSRIRSDISSSFELDDETMLVLAQPISMQNLQLVLVTVVPELDFTANVVRGRRILVPVVIVSAILTPLKRIPWRKLLGLCWRRK